MLLREASTRSRSTALRAVLVTVRYRARKALTLQFYANWLLSPYQLFALVPHWYAWISSSGE